ncbi:unnamed protein product [Bursaphelenchus xylophilus]|uniref:(pine wood nematode) hypothetical protein n=1 Tax=Bursaphelenchus xylophilus TaxID=6326 RepID=A0A1I7RTJ1_BURXY|nr:unnamed protein product [Bursaphelenchus xylophilus]CAG9122403.1 unnamed protein product [Bursaphelenchus xylophilus]
MRENRAWDNMSLVPYFDRHEDIYNDFTTGYRLFAVVTFVMKVYYVRRIASLSALHINFRITICNTVISMEIMHITLLLGHIYNDLTIDNENRLGVNIGCTVLGMLNNIAAVDASVSMLMLAVERQLAYNFVDVYETKARALAWTLVFIMLGISLTVGIFSWYVFMFLYNDFDFYTSRMSCLPIHINWFYEVAAFTFSSSSCLLGAAWLAVLRKSTRQGRLNRLSLRSLSARFQATENSYTTASIFPSMATFVLAAWTGLAIGVYRGILAQKYGDHTVFSKFLGDVGFLIVDLYSLCHISCTIAYVPLVKSAFVRDLNRLTCWQMPRKPNKLDCSNAGEIYFDQLKDSWNR